MKQLLIISFLLPFLAFSQDTNFVLEDKEYIGKIEVKANEWETFDTLLVFHEKGNENSMPELVVFIYSDDGADCNNEFWKKETFTVEDDRVVVLTHNFQKTGIDPIPEFEKRIYMINETGHLSLIYEKYKHYNSDEWTSP